jgi:hypothetical protein
MYNTLDHFGLSTTVVPVGTFGSLHVFTMVVPTLVVPTLVAIHFLTCFDLWYLLILLYGILAIRGSDWG